MPQLFGNQKGWMFFYFDRLPSFTVGKLKILLNTY